MEFPQALAAHVTGLDVNKPANFICEDVVDHVYKKRVYARLSGLGVTVIVSRRSRLAVSMAVPETSPPVPVARNDMRMIAQTVVQSEGVHRGVVGRFRQSRNKEILLAKETSLVLACPTEDGGVLAQHIQPVHGTVLDLKLLHAPHHLTPGQVRQPRCPLASSHQRFIISLFSDSSCATCFWAHRGLKRQCC